MLNRPWENDPLAQSFGAWLRRQREVREIGLREIGDATKISMRYLEALEQDRFEVLPAPVFAKGFLREYARFVGLDPDEVVNYFIAALPGPGNLEEQKPSSRRAPRERLRVWPVLTLISVLLAVSSVAYYTWAGWRPSSSSDDVPIMVPAAAAMLPEPIVEAAPAQPSAPLRLTLDFNQNSWVNVFIDGERRFSELRVQGESLRLLAEREIRVSLGNVDGVSLELNGQAYTAKARDDQEFVVDLGQVQDAGEKSN